eukprot:SAG31_NODE_25554_length_459_cov_0.858333_1_plen_32_part_01
MGAGASAGEGGGAPGFMQCCAVDGADSAPYSE